jgi:hypothetical protein
VHNRSESATTAEYGTNITVRRCEVDLTWFSTWDIRRNHEAIGEAGSLDLSRLDGQFHAPKRKGLLSLVERPKSCHLTSARAKIG